MTPLNPKIKLLAFVLTFPLLLCFNDAGFAQKKTPRFKDYPVTAVFRGKNAPLKLTRGDEVFRDRLQWAIDNQKVNSAGHYIAASWSCGTWCSWSAFIDAKTGKVYWWDGSLSVCFKDSVEKFNCDEKFENTKYRIDSKLIIFFGRRNNKDGDNGFHYYKFENGRFIHLKSVLSKDQRRATEVLLDEKTN